MLYFQSTIQDLFNIDIAENDAARRMAEVLDKDNEKERKRQKDDTQVYFSFSYICVLRMIS
jgi:transcription termination factor NusB